MSSHIYALAAFLSFAAADDTHDEFADFFPGDDEMSAALKEVAENRRKKARAEMVEVLDEVFDAYDTSMTSRVLNLRRLRKQEKEWRKGIAALKRAKSYAAETKNFCPLLHLLGRDYAVGYDNEEQRQRMIVIPADYKPKESSK